VFSNIVTLQTTGSPRASILELLLNNSGPPLSLASSFRWFANLVLTFY
jgi:hypothetical protein